MGQPVARFNDICGAPIVASANKVITNGRPTAVINDAVVPHFPCGPHCASRTCTASSSVYAQGKPVHRLGDACSCGHSTSTGSGNVRAGG